MAATASSPWLQPNIARAARHCSIVRELRGNVNFLIDLYYSVKTSEAIEQMLQHLLDLTTSKLQGARIMADSDNSRTLPTVTGGDSDSFAAAHSPACTVQSSKAVPLPEIRSNKDQAIDVMQERSSARQFPFELVRGEKRSNCHFFEHDQHDHGSYRIRFVKRTPTPPPFSGINSTPAVSRDMRISFRFADVIAGSPSSASARRIVEMLTLASCASSSAVHRTSARAARIWAPVITFINFDFPVELFSFMWQLNTHSAEPGAPTPGTA